MPWYHSHQAVRATVLVGGRESPSTSGLLWRWDVWYPWWGGIAAAMNLPAFASAWGITHPSLPCCSASQTGGGWRQLGKVSRCGRWGCGESTTEEAPAATSSSRWPVLDGFGSILNLPWMGRFLPVWGSLSKGMFAFPRGDEYQVLWVLQGMFFSFTVHLVPPWKQMLYNLLSEGPLSAAVAQLPTGSAAAPRWRRVKSC